MDAYQRGFAKGIEEACRFIERRIGDSNRGAIGWIPEALGTLPLPPPESAEAKGEPMRPVGWVVRGLHADDPLKLHHSLEGARRYAEDNDVIYALYPADSLPEAKPAMPEPVPGPLTAGTEAKNVTVMPSLPEPSEEWVETIVKGVQWHPSAHGWNVRSVISEYRKLCESAAGGGSLGATEPPGRGPRVCEPSPAALRASVSASVIANLVQSHQLDGSVVRAIHDAIMAAVDALTGAKR